MTQPSLQTMSPEAAATVPRIIPFVLILTSVVSILSTDLYTPSLPDLQQIFLTDAATVQLTMSLNVLGFAAAQLVYGPLSDRFGRRPVMLAGITAFIVIAIGCALAQSIEALIVARALQGIAAAVEAVLIYAIIRDLYRDDQAVRLLAFYGMAIALAPAVGPIIGGYIHVAFGWRSNFVLLALMGAMVTILLWRYLPESTTPDKTALRPRRLVLGYSALLGNAVFMLTVLSCAASLGALFAYITAGPFVFIEMLHVPVQHYGFYQAALVAAFFVGSLVTNRAARQVRAEILLTTGLAIGALGGAYLLSIQLIGWITPISLTIGAVIFGSGLGPILAAGPIRAFAATTASTGFAAALLGATEMAGAAVGAFVVGILHDGTAQAFVWGIAGFTLLALAINLVDLLFLRHRVPVQSP